MSPAAIGRMPPAKVVGEPAADGVELDPAPDAPAAAELLRLLERHHFRLEKLQLQRHREAVLQPARPHADEALTGDEHLPRDHRLETVEVGQPVRVSLVGPGEP